MLVNVNPKNDFAFKAVFGSERHTRVLIHLLNAILVPCGLRVLSVQILNPFSEIREWDDKRLILDVKAVDQLGRLYNIEMQMVPAPSFPGRFLYYWSSMYGSQLKEGDRYDLLRPVISICFLDGILFPQCDEYHLRFQLLERAAYFPLSDDLDLHLFQLAHFTRMADELETDLDLWLYVLNNGKGMDTENLPSKLRVAEIEEALEAWAMLTEDQIKREIYEAREKARRDAEDWRSALERAKRDAEDWKSASERAEQRAQHSFAEGQEAGLAKGVIIGQIRLCEELLRCEPTSEAELAVMSIDDLRQLANQLGAELRRQQAADSAE
jgi:predicted transposase/invertase (TIGR01784 family)